jgi:hypothetical protein
MTLITPSLANFITLAVMVAVILIAFGFAKRFMPAKG